MNRNAYKLPSDPGRQQTFHFHFGSYLGQNSVKGRDFARFDLPRIRRRRRRVFYRLLAAGVLIYIIIESLRGLSLLRI
jgi:hypothetical protein